MLYTPLAFAVAGAFMNRVRGGMWDLPAGRYLNAQAFGLAVWAASGNSLTGALAMFGMVVGQAPGWGRYIGALGGWEEEELDEWWPADVLIRDMRDEPKLWGFTGLVLRGFFWGACLGLPLLSWWPVLAGMAMPFCYAGAFAVCRWLVTSNPDGDGWELGEVLFGALLWGAAGLAYL